MEKHDNSGPRAVNAGNAELHHSKAGIISRAFMRALAEAEQQTEVDINSDDMLSIGSFDFGPTFQTTTGEAFITCLFDELRTLGVKLDFSAVSE
ncbi:hypothetical protein K3172_13080 [Qipengyuania sp. 6B39]|uniref:hypothetical protein n=1 Tax=Qipengyuania proteolytica TaxID=2867239 RepID=UPI001C89D096|nr:hypothetical protein [Qipengyuania proteolytica]MBX7496793.1 hypothetical protein [Qipengyuania proteolytica]